MITSVAKLRDAPYLKSSHVMSLPSSHFTPSLTVKLQDLPPSVVVPVSVARSAIGVVPSTGSLDAGSATRLR